MKAKDLIEEMGGSNAVRKLTGLTRGRISQWVVNDSIPRPWAMFLSSIHPSLDFTRFIQKHAE